MEPPKIGLLDERFTLAWHAMNDADRTSLEAFTTRSYHQWTKGNNSPVTDVELAIERAIAGKIHRDFADDAVLGEEQYRTDESRTRWIVDPIDGTANFIEGIPIYAHMICYQQAGSTVFSLVSAPALGARWWAYRGRGAFKGSVSIAVSSVSEVDEARIAYGGLRDYVHLLPAFVGLVSSCLRARGFGNFLPHMLVAEGTYDLASSAQGCAEWDVAPLMLIVEEAGGMLTGFDGRPWRGSGPILTSNGFLHQKAVRHLESAP